MYRVSGGRFLWTPASKRGWGALHLTTIGRKTGQERSVVLGYLDAHPDASSGWHARSRAPCGHVLLPAGT